LLQAEPGMKKKAAIWGDISDKYPFLRCPTIPYPQLYRWFVGNGTLATGAISPNPGGLLVPIVTLLGDSGFGNASERTGMSR
jgi:hypothetical protein